MFGIIKKKTNCKFLEYTVQRTAGMRANKLLPDVNIVSENIR